MKGSEFLIENLFQLFIGGVYDSFSISEYLKKSKNGIQNAVNNHQKNIILMVNDLSTRPIQVVSGKFVENFPNYKDVYIGKRNFQFALDGFRGLNIGFINLFPIKQIDRYIRMNVSAIKEFKKYKADCRNIVYCYYCNLPFMSSAVSIKRRYPDTKLVLIVPDIPDFLSLSIRKKFTQKIATIMSYNRINSLIQEFDGYILLTENMKEPLKIGKKPYFVMDGIVNADEVVSIEEIETKEYDRKTIVYSGSLNEKYGILILLKAFEILKQSDLILHIFGSGEMEEHIIRASHKDRRIIFHGYKDKEIIIEHQRKASLLVNPRSNIGEYNKYSFPSKNLEYLMSGTPVICSKLSGMSREYDDIMFTLDEMNEKTLSQAIIDILKMNSDRLKEMTKKAREFVLQNKTKEVYKSNMENFIFSLLSEE